MLEHLVSSCMQHICTTCEKRSKNVFKLPADKVVLLGGLSKRFLKKISVIVTLGRGGGGGGGGGGRGEAITL